MLTTGRSSLIWCCCFWESISRSVCWPAAAREIDRGSRCRWQKPGLPAVFFMTSEDLQLCAFLGQPGWAYEHGVQILANVGIFIGMVRFWLGPRSGLPAASTAPDTSSAIRRSLPIAGLRAVARSRNSGHGSLYLNQMIGRGTFSYHTAGAIPFWMGALLASV